MPVQFIHSYGGQLGFAPYQASLPASGALPPTTLQTRLPVDRWELERTWTDDETTGTGNMGWEQRNLTRMGFRLAAEITWDIYAPPSFVVENATILSPPGVSSPDVGYRFWAYMGSPEGYGFPAAVDPPYWFAPSVKASACKTISDAAGNQVIRARVDVFGNGPIFAMNATINEQAAYNAFIAHCLTRNWGW